MAHDRSCQHRADQTHPTIADQLDRVTDRIDALTHRVRLAGKALSPDQYHEAEAEAQAIAATLVETFRGKRATTPTNPPIWVSPCGTRMAW